MRFIDRAMRWAALATTALAASASLSSLTACGDGGPPPDCSTYAVALTYRGAATGASMPLDANLADVTVGTPMSIPAPTLPDFVSAPSPTMPTPASCVNGATWSASGLPPGVVMDARTGALSGTPTQGGSFDVVVQIETAAPSVRVADSDFTFQVHDPATTWVSSWDAGRPLPAGGGQLAVQGGDLVWLQAGAAGMEVRRSHDGGTTWTLDAPATVPPARQRFAVATDAAGRLYLAGGYVDPAAYTTSLVDLWVYDGTDWTQLFAQAPYIAQPTDQPVLYIADGALFALNIGNNVLWRSVDDGLSWVQVNSSVVPYSFEAQCGGNLGGKQVIVGAGVTDMLFEPLALRALQSTDGGATWTEPLGDSPYLNGLGHCQFTGTDLFVAVIYERTPAWTVLGTSGLGSWAQQAYRPEWATQGFGLDQGSAAVGGTLYFADSGVLYTGSP